MFGGHVKFDLKKPRETRQQLVIHHLSQILPNNTSRNSDSNPRREIGRQIDARQIFRTLRRPQFHPCDFQEISWFPFL
jgi:hypothetical protein